MKYFNAGFFMCCLVFMVSCGKKDQYDLQFAQTNQDYIARHFAADAIKRDVKTARLYDGLLNEKEISRSIADQYCRDMVFNTLRRKWKTDASGNFMSISKSMIGMKIDYDKPDLEIQFEFYEDQNSFDKKNSYQRTVPSHLSWDSKHMP